MVSKQLRLELQDGDFPLLSKSQMRILDEVRGAVDQRFRDVRYINGYFQNYDEDRVLDIMIKVTAMEENLNVIIEHLKKGRVAKRHFAKLYPEFKRNRDDCTVQLFDIAESLNTDRFNCNVSKLVGYSTSFVGGGLLLASAILLPFTFGLTAPLAVAGGAITAAGATTAIGTSVTEFALLKSKVDKAKLLVEKDKRYFEEMNEWLIHAAKLQQALADVLSIDVIKELADSIKELVEKAMKMAHEATKRSRFIQQNINKILNTFQPSLANMSVPIVAIATIVTVLVAVFLLLINTENRLVFDCASLTVRSILGIASLVDDSMDAIRLTSLFASNAAAKTLARAVTRGAVASVGMILDVIGIVLTSIDVHHGSISPEAEKIKEAAKQMREEADVFENVYIRLPQPIE